MNELALFALLAAAVAQGAWVASDSEVFEPVRDWVFDRLCGSRCTEPFWRWLHKGLECPFCTGVWLAFAAALVLRPDFLPGGAWTSVPVYAFALALAARATHATIELLREVTRRLEVDRVDLDG